ncbi:MAG: major facilitator transporter [Chloroflexi bacterium OLB14]|nr:MAG: major facilitator transporter [Chloroflexi bacterium OLB14]
MRIQLIIFMFLRTILNTAHRMVYPFLSVFARGLGVNLETMSIIMTLRSLVGAVSPLFAPIADKRGRKFGMLLGVSIFIAGMLIVTLRPSLWTLAIALMMAMIGKFIFDPSMQAYFGDRIPYHKRGTALAVTEVAWSFAFILGIPLVGFLIDQFGWSAPFPVFTLLGLIIFFVIWKIIPNQDEHHEPASNLSQAYRTVLTSPIALAGIAIALFASSANELVNVIFGVWLEDSFGLQILALAGASAVIGISELSGEGLVALTTDKLGKPLALTIGIIGNIIAALLLPFIGQTQTGALIGLFLFYITFEYIMVSHIPMMTELIPSARATMLSMNVTGHAIGRAIGALFAAYIYQQFGFLCVALIAVAFNLLGLLALWRLQIGVK